MIVTIVGGGTAGWLTAFYIKYFHSDYEVSLIESTQIGILGAGEGGTPNLHYLLMDLFKFDENEFLNSVNGTRKYGIVFDKWSDDLKHSFVHGFDGKGLENETDYSYHFDARLFAEFMKKKSLSIGVNHIDNEISDFKLDNNKVSQILLKDGTHINTNFVFDCSGFSRLIIGKLYNTKWNSYEDELLVNSAIPFFINEPNINLNQKTIAGAMPYGWMWKIPLQNRWGCGYLYNDRMIDDEYIEKEVLRLYGDRNIKINKKIKFNAGSYENVWVENCIAVGLSSGFLEPLEATSIMTIIYQLKLLPEDLSNELGKNDYNYYVNSINFQNMMFIRHHYNCSRNDSVFWNTYKTKELSEFLLSIYDSLNNPYKSLKALFNLKNTKNLIMFSKEQYMHILNNNFAKNKKTFI